MEITEIKNRLTLAEVIKGYGLKADKYNRINCPFHEDKTPSLQLYWKTHTAYCFSANCPTHGKSLDVIDFVMYMESINKHEAIEKCKKMLNGNHVTLKTTSTFDRPTLLTNMFTYFKNAVNNSKPARQYLETRNLDYTKLEIGYNSGQFHHGARKDPDMINDCVRAGLLTDNDRLGRTGDPSYKPFGKYGIVFALRNRTGQVTGLYFRSTVNDTDQKHYYLKEREGLYPGYPPVDTKTLLLTEAIIDCATISQHLSLLNPDKLSLLSCYGTNGLTEQHLRAIMELKELQEIIFFFDGDEAGRQAVTKYAEELHILIPEPAISTVNTPENEDINSMLQGHTPDIYTHLIDTRTFLFQLRIQTTESTEKENTPPASITPVDVPEASPPELDSYNPYKLKYITSIAGYYVQGGIRKEMDSMKITLVIEHSETKIKSRSKIDLYEDKQIEKLSREAGEKLSLRPDQIEKDLSVLTDLLEKYRDKLMDNKEEELKKPEIFINPDLHRKCMEFLQKPFLVKRINDLIGKSGVAGEENSRIFLFVVACSYRMKDTLHALIQGSSGSGKTRLLKAVSSLVPQEDMVSFTRVTDNSFYNYPEYYFVNKLVCFEDIDGLKEEAQLAVRELQSNEILTSSTSGKTESGQIRSEIRTVRGPIASLACTTHGELYEDNVSRCFVIAIDESMEQTLKIIKYQNNKAAGMIDEKKEKHVRYFIQNCVRLLKSHEVVNPYANKIKLPEDAHKIRRLNELFQSLVRQITLINQYQRKKDQSGRLMSEKEDLLSACEIMFESIVLKVDELDGSLRQFYEKLKSFVNEKGRDYEFNRFEVRQATGISKTQQHIYMSRLVELEYIRQYGFANRGFKYKISCWDNMQALREKIRQSLEDQLQAL